MFVLDRFCSILNFQGCKNSIIIDTDDIDDPNSIKIINKYSFTTKTDNKKFDSELAKLNKIEINKILNKNKNKNIIYAKENGFFYDTSDNIYKNICKLFKSVRI